MDASKHPLTVRNTTSRRRVGMVGTYRDSLTFLQNVGKHIFLFFAYGFWPIYVPVAMYFTESISWRKNIMLLLTFMGIGVVLTIFMNFSISESSPQILGNSIRYIYEPLVVYKLFYLACVVLPFFFSSLPYTWIFAVLITLAFFISDYLYFVDFTSIWCFFGAIFSIAIYWVVKNVVK